MKCEGVFRKENRDAILAPIKLLEHEDPRVRSSAVDILRELVERGEQKPHNAWVSLMYCEEEFHGQLRLAAPALTRLLGHEDLGVVCSIADLLTTPARQGG
jgi:hypothetical protein